VPRWWLVRTPWRTVMVWSGDSASVQAGVAHGRNIGIDLDVLKAGPFTTYAEAEAARRRWEEPT
jgi:hypothetical protein